MPDGDYAAFVERQARGATRPGPIVDETGREIGRHAGVHRFTVGQRRGLGLTSSRPRYVLSVAPATATLVVGDEEGLLSDALRVRDVNWLSTPEPASEFRASVRIRYRHPEAQRDHPPAARPPRARCASTPPSARSPPARRPSSTRARSAWAAAGSSRHRDPIRMESTIHFLPYKFLQTPVIAKTLIQYEFDSLTPLAQELLV